MKHTDKYKYKIIKIRVSCKDTDQASRTLAFIIITSVADTPLTTNIGQLLI